MQGADKLGTRKNSTSNVENLDMCAAEDEGFIEGDVSFGKSIASFSFGTVSNESVNNKQDAKASEQPHPMSNKSAANEMTGMQFYSTNPNGQTPPIDGESFTIKRGYQFRKSTLKKLNELKANHPDINVYLNTIIDEAISYYYDYIFNNKNS
jgi:hypothetical protein